MKYGIAFLLLLFTANSFGQDSDLGNWWIYFGNKKLNEKFNLHHEVQYRNYNAIGDLEQLLLRSGMGYNLSENNNNLLLGYGYILSSNYISDDEKQDVEEHRIYQQFITKQTFGRVKWQHRYRVEERFIESKFKMRFRYFLSVNVALNKATFDDGTLYLSAYNEVFLASTSPVFDRNRAYGGLGYKISPLARVELGYMNQFFERSGRDQVNVILFLSF